ncbi:hypothetical protein [Marinibactrum halimedae]|uniref:Uncharacterized protein n=1 Tax=Marinibactrum halimedae TaxID=1444977 RepID=A0AA37TCN9_9GAMM|nr:hypothetical protein [Marinibactrum halimedae]MCD9461329.1 hypothetical protein [Marinibactrum halimedae]GLS27911.1 hypothetical protein GCM10007877_36300 [Marinibactrum halimedae]
MKILIIKTEHKIALVLAFIFFLGYQLTPEPSLNELVSFEGEVKSVNKKKAAGFTMYLVSEDGETKVFNIPNSSKVINKEISLLSDAYIVEVLYDPRYSMKGNSFDVWQLKRDEAILIGYDESRDTAKLYSLIFISCSLFSFFVFLMLQVFSKKT